ncbi:MAG: glycosyltransferase [Myxococcota bacterium]|nr:glycosyltransferase [Myxococcota bacterium]
MTDDQQHRLLIFIVAYNAESTLLQVIDRIPLDLFSTYDTEILVIDDASDDQTFDIGRALAGTWSHCKITVLTNPENQGYGGNQKLGYEYAIRYGFDTVALLHGDGQYAPEKLPDLVQPIAAGEAAAVFGSRMMIRGGALKGGMPLYKYVGNKILTGFQNKVLGASLSEFHSGFRAYATAVLQQIPFQLNANDFHFDTDIIIQLMMGKHRIIEIPMPTFYGDEVCYVNGLDYAKNVVHSTITSRLQSMGIRYQRKFDLTPTPEDHDLKLGYPSSHSLAIDATPAGARVLYLGTGSKRAVRELKAKGCQVVGLNVHHPAADPEIQFIDWDLEKVTIPEEVFNYDYVLLLDVIEHLKNPEQLVDLLRRGAQTSRPTIILTTANVTFFILRLMFLFGQFNYSKVGILDKTHTRLFTFYTMKHLFEQSGYEIIDVKGIPAPFPKALGDSRLSRTLVQLNEALIKLRKSIFSYQMYFVARPLPTVDTLLNTSITYSNSKREEKADIKGGKLVP